MDDEVVVRRLWCPVGTIHEPAQEPQETLAGAKVQEGLLAPDIALFLGLEADAVIHGAGDGLSKIGLLLDDGCWLLATGYWLLATGYWLLAIGYWLLLRQSAPARRSSWHPSLTLVT